MGKIMQYAVWGQPAESEAWGLLPSDTQCLVGSCLLRHVFQTPPKLCELRGEGGAGQHPHISRIGSIDCREDS